MPTLTRPDGTQADDLNLSRRGFAGVVAMGYAAFAAGADAQPIVTPADGLLLNNVVMPGGLPAYVAQPAAPGRYGAVIVVNEIFGVHEYIRDICRRLARLGYVAIAPEFFYRADPERTLATTSDRAALMKIVGTANNAQVMGDVGTTINWLSGQGFVAPERIGITGFCWGGTVVWMAAARFAAIKAGVAWYGRLAAPPSPQPGDPAPEPRRYPLDLARELRAPVLGLYGGQDKGIPMADVETMRARLDGAAVPGDMVVYPAAQHGFHADYRPSYDPAAAADGWARLIAWYKQHGVPPGTA